jgi:predicted anti-sigma-YlaC factor YlaD
MSARNDILPALFGPTGPQVNCEECFEPLDEYVELELEGADAEPRVPGMRAHLDGCPACRESTRACARSPVAELQRACGARNPRVRPHGAG